MSVQDRAALVAERDFLLDSIRRLDEDKALDAISEAEYIDLRDEQTLRAARVLEQLDAIPAAEDSHPDETKDLTKSKVDSKAATRMLDLSGHKRVVWIAGLVAFAVLAVGGVILASGGRVAGEGPTGTISADSNTLLARAADQSGKGNVADAVKTYDQVLKQDPQNIQALTYRGWLIRLAGLPQQGLDSINQALAISPNYPDAHFFKGFILFRDRQDPKDAITEFNSFLADNPPKDMVPLVQQTLQDAQAEAKSQK